ncbi:MAG: hypothetical protein LBG48_02585 [Rickettsiales bacterium]|jgi:hypothetical protein|nr:hypothetical protein [Rickettsiales bacterium]
MDDLEKKEKIASLKKRADEVYELALKHPGVPFKVDPELAEFMGAFEDPALDEMILYDAMCELKKEKDE